VKKTYIFLSLILLLGITTAWLTYSYDNPPQTKTILDRNGNYLASFGTIEGGRQIWVEEFPEDLVQSLLQKEDRAFYYHLGINPVSLVKAAFENISHHRIVRGGSTITQQLAKNLITLKDGERPARNLFNKFTEALLAIGLEFKYSKKEILNRYLNTIYLGHRTYGFGAGALYYFSPADASPADGDLKNLSAEQIDYLTSLPRSPNNISCPKKLCQDISVSEEIFNSRIGFHFAQYAASKSNSHLIKTSLDKDLQRNLEAAVKKIIAARVTEDPLLNTAAVVIDVKTNDILAMVGSRDLEADEAQGQVNATIALRQPGSTLKPFTYFAAFSKGYTPDSLVPDEPLSFTNSQIDELGYMPQNFDKHFRGQVTVREALANSYNVPAVATLNDIGLSYYHGLLKKFGFDSINQPISHYGLSVTLGSGEVTLVELTRAYATLARSGKNASNQLIIPDADYYAGQITKILADPNARVKTFGWNEDLLIQEETVAVKTGTSYELRDNWTVGYTPDFAVGVWVGHNDATPLLTADGGTTGATGAGPIWHAVMQQTLREMPHEKRRDWLASLPKAPLDHSVGGRPQATPVAAMTASSWRVTAPLMNSSYRRQPGVPEESQKILAHVNFESDKQTPLKWFLNGDPLIEAQGQKEAWLTPTLGRNVLVVEDENGKTEKVFFELNE